MSEKTSLVVNLVIGLPGSGKTFHANKLGGYVVDDIKDVSELPTKIDQHWTITDPNFCDDKNLTLAQSTIVHYARRAGAGAVSFKLHYFKNEPEKCRKNVRYRNDGRVVEGTLRRFERIYTPPSNAIDVWEAPCE